MSKKIIIVQVGMLCLMAVLFVVYMMKRPAPENLTFTVASSSPLQMKNEKLGIPAFVNPEVAVDVNKHFIINFKPLRLKLSEIKDAQKQNTYVYFAYLNNSSWIGLNEKDLFTAASTVKVPLAMAIYKMEEEGRLKLSDVYSLDELDLDKHFGDLYKAGPDQSFTIDELLGIMLVYSDNTAMQALIHVFKLMGIDDPWSDVYSAMGWEYNDFGTVPTYIDINLKTLSNMFISLYNATYISAEHSDAILKYLTESAFDEQITAGVPKGIMTAHKIGLNEANNTYSDCGIIYAPNRPYLLCVGSSGVAKVKADSFIKEISRAVYQYIINN